MDFSNLRVLDLGTAVAGPYAAAFFSDLGAEVIKVEKPRRGDSIRFADKYVKGECGYFLGVNRGKQSITLDVRKPQGQALILELAKQADVLIENFRPGVMDRWGIGWQQLKELNPRLVYCSITAFPEARGFEKVSGNDITVQAYSGVMDMTGYPEAMPAKVGVPVVDAATAMLAAMGALAALLRRESTGRGEHVRASLLEGAFALMPNFTVTELNTEHRFARLGSGHPQIVPYEAFMCADAAHVVVGAFHREMWANMCRVMGLEALRDDPRFAENFDRVRHRGELVPLLQKAFLAKTRDAWMALFAEADIPCAPILSIRDSLTLFTERLPELTQSVTHSKAGPLRMLRPPIRFEDEPVHAPTQASPTLGEHTEQVLRRLNLPLDTIARLREEGIV